MANKVDYRKGLASQFTTDEKEEYVVKILKLIKEYNLDYLNEYNLVVSREQVFDKLITFRFLKFGSCGEVFEATFKPGIKIGTKEQATGLNRKIALKRIKLTYDKEEDEKIMREVINQVVINQKLEKNENIVEFIDYITHIDNSKTLYLYIVMEYCKLSLSEWFQEKDELEDRIREESLEMFLSIAEGVTFLHEQGFVHRDLKPSNIMIDEKGICKVADFGLSKVMESKFQSISNYYNTVGVGTPIYVAPEQLDKSSEGKYGQKIDIYPLGCILMEFFMAFLNKEELTQAIKNIRNHHQIPASITLDYPNEAQLILMMTNVDPSKRPTIVQVVHMVKQSLE